MADIIHGSAKWNEWEGFRKEEAYGWGAAFGPNQNSYGKESHIITLRPDRHFLSVAPTRSGKGVSLIIPNLLYYQGSAIVIDPKGENAWVTAKCRRDELGQKTIILDPWGEVNRRYGSKVEKRTIFTLEEDKAGITSEHLAESHLETVCRFNPLSILDPANDNYADDLAYIADALIINQGKDPHWDDSARELVAGLIAFAVETNPTTATLPFVRVILSKPYDEIAALAKKAQELGYESVAARKLGRFAVDSKEISSIVSTALTQTAFLDSATLAESLSFTDFSFSDLVDQKATIYLVLPVDKLQTYGRWLRLMGSLGIRTVARNTQQLRYPVLFVLDEFGTIGKLSAVSQAYGLMAGLQMCIWAFVQDLVQLKRDYPEEWETFIGNSEGVSFFDVMDQFTAEHLSKMLGKTTIERISQTTAEERKGGFFKEGDPNYTRMSDQYYQRDLLQPSEIRGASKEFGFIVARDNPIWFKKMNYHTDPFFYERARQNPYYLDPKAVAEKAAEKKKNEHLSISISGGDIHAARNVLTDRGYKVEAKGILGSYFFVTSPKAGEGKKEYNKKDLLRLAADVL